MSSNFDFLGWIRDNRVGPYSKNSVSKKMINESTEDGEINEFDFDPDREAEWQRSQEAPSSCVRLYNKKGMTTDFYVKIDLKNRPKPDPGKIEGYVEDPTTSDRKLIPVGNIIDNEAGYTDNSCRNVSKAKIGNYDLNYG